MTKTKLPLTDLQHTTKEIHLLERTKDSTSTIIGFYSSEKLAVDSVKHHVEATIDKAVQDAHASSGSQHIGIYIQEGFLISKNEVEVDDLIDFDKIEDPEEFPGEGYHVAEDLGDVKDQAPGADFAKNGGDFF